MRNRSLPADEEHVPMPNAGGQPLVSDFFRLGERGQMPFYLQFNAHGNGNVAGQNNNDWANWEQNIQQDDAALDLNQAPTDLALEANLITPPHSKQLSPSVEF
jgi:outer membrane PBP1 activator LpoA protein